MGTGASSKAAGPAKIAVASSASALAEPPARVESARRCEGSSLAARRNFLSLPLKATQRAPSLFRRKTPPNYVRNSIQRIDAIENYYTLGHEVMRSGHPGMLLLYGRRHKDARVFVVKIREKATSFVGGESDERDWRYSTELVLNLPPSKTIARFYEVLEDDDAYYVIMEKIDGEDLWEVMEQKGCFSVFECREVIQQLLQAVSDLHDKGCLHKDIKLENVMVEAAPSPSRFLDSLRVIQAWSPDLRSVLRSTTKDSKDTSSTRASFLSTTSTTSVTSESSPRVKLIDFDTLEEASPDAFSTSVVGTDQYIAPEAYAGKYTQASDVFSVGVILYKLLTGEFPFDSAMFSDEAGQNWVGSPQMQEIKDRLEHFEVDYSRPPLDSEPLALDLCRSMLLANESERPTAARALEHDWFCR